MSRCSLDAVIAIGTATVVVGASASWGCGDDGPSDLAVDASIAREAASPGTGVTDASPIDAAPVEHADASDAADACASCASHACTDGGCDPAVFVTSKTFTGVIGDAGVLSADQECAALAAAAGLPGTFKAWISGAGDPSPAARFVKSTRPYRRLDGARVAADFAALEKTLEKPISVTEKGVDIDFSFVWTATNGDGTATPNGGDCAGWSSSDVSAKGGAGESDDIVAEWTSFGDVACSTSARLYCFEQQP